MKGEGSTQSKDSHAFQFRLHDQPYMENRIDTSELPIGHRDFHIENIKFGKKCLGAI